MMKLTKQSQMVPISSVIRQLLIQLESFQSASGLFGSYKKGKHRIDFPPPFIPTMYSGDNQMSFKLFKELYYFNHWSKA